MCTWKETDIFNEFCRRTPEASIATNTFNVLQCVSVCVAVRGNMADVWKIEKDQHISQKRPVGVSKETNTMPHRLNDLQKSFHLSKETGFSAKETNKSKRPNETCFGVESKRNNNCMNDRKRLIHPSKETGFGTEISATVSFVKRDLFGCQKRPTHRVDDFKRPIHLFQCWKRPFKLSTYNYFGVETDDYICHRCSSK